MKKLLYGLVVGVIVFGTVVYLGRDSFAQPLFNRGGEEFGEMEAMADEILPAVSAPDNVIVELVAPDRNVGSLVCSSSDDHIVGLQRAFGCVQGKARAIF